MARPKTNIEDTGIDAVVNFEVTMPGQSYMKHTVRVKNVKGSIVESQMNPVTLIGPMLAALRKFGPIE